MDSPQASLNQSPVKSRTPTLHSHVLTSYQEAIISLLFEIKYVKSGNKPGEKEIQRLKNEAGFQLQQYSIDEKFRKTIEKTELIKIIIIFAGNEAVYIGQLK